MIIQNIHYKDNNTFASLLDMIYPIGSAYFSISNDSPAVLFGGTWTKKTGGVLALAGTDGYAAVDKTGGNDTLTINQIPAHTHNASSDNAGAHYHAPGTRSDNKNSRFALAYSDSKEIQLQSFNTAFNSSSDYRAIGFKLSDFSDGHGAVSTYTSNNGIHSHTITIESSGGGGAHVHQHYSIYCWVRTA